MPQNDFLQFAAGGDANVQDQTDYAASDEVLNGYGLGESPASDNFNKAMRQSSAIAAALAAWLVAQTGSAMLDNGDLAGKVALLNLGIRTKLLANTTYNVSPAGSDVTGDGSAGNPWATAQHAVAVLTRSIDMNGYSVTVKRADGNYTDPVTVTGPLVGQTGAASLIFDGNSANPANVKVTTNAASAYVASDGAAFTVQNQQIKTTGASGYGVRITNGSGGQIANLIMDACVNAHFDASINSSLRATGATPFTIIGNAAQTLHVVENSLFLSSAGQTMTWTGPIAYSSCTALSYGCSMIDFAGAGSGGAATLNFTGAITGQRYQVSNGAVINTNGGGANFIPGSVAGSTFGGTGQYN